METFEIIVGSALTIAAVGFVLVRLILEYQIRSIRKKMDTMNQRAQDRLDKFNETRHT
tara:strand:- start:326 stop:499 length:174 start_codon:yes stop_codon:yes gene_type:complete